MSHAHLRICHFLENVNTTTKFPIVHLRVSTILPPLWHAGTRHCGWPIFSELCPLHDQHHAPRSHDPHEAHTQAHVVRVRSGLQRSGVLTTAECQRSRLVGGVTSALMSIGSSCSVLCMLCMLCAALQCGRESWRILCFQLLHGQQKSAIGLLPSRH